jgi:hypothetical protein
LRESLTAFAVLLILVLTAALLGPMLVDWTSRRSDVEQRLSQAIGAPVKTAGTIKLRFLPSPFLEVAEIEAGSGVQPQIAAEGARIELAPMALLQGQIRVVDAELVRPKLRLTLDQNATVVLPSTPKASPELVRFEHIKITDGSVLIHDTRSGADLTFDGIDTDANARSLAGPFNATGTLAAVSGRRFAVPIAFHLATGIRENNRMKIKLIADSSLLHGDLDGALLFAGTGGAIGFEGNGVFSGQFSSAGAEVIPVRLSAALQIDAHKALFGSVELRAGADERELVASGEAQVMFGAQAQGRIVLNARQLELDHLLAAKGESALSPARLLERLRPLLGDRSLTAALPLPLTIETSIEMVTLGGESVTDLSTRIVVAPTKPMLGRVELTAPGRTRIIANGSLETGAAAHFSGHIDAASQDVARFEDWLRADTSQAGALRALLSFHSAAVAGDFELSGVAISGRNLTLTVNRSKLVGALAFTRAIGTERARLFADMTSDALDLDAVPDLSELVAVGATIDASLAFDARAVKVNRVGQGMIDAGHIGIKLTSNGDMANLERFEIAGLGGADLSLTGSRDRRGGKLDLRLKAARLGDLAELLTRVAPGRATSLLAERAAALSPAQINIHIEGAVAPAGDWRLTALAVNGTAGATKISGDSKPDALDPQTFDASLVLDAPESAPLLRQFGFSALPLNGQGKGHVEMALGGRFGAPIDLLADATIAGANLTAQGQISLPPDAVASIPQSDGSAMAGPIAWRRIFDGTIGFKAKDAGPLGQMLSLVLPDLTIGLPVDVKARAQWTTAGLTLAGLKGVFNGAQLSGKLNWRPTGSESDGLSGNLSFDRLASTSLLALALGAPPETARGSWPTQDFGSGLVNPPPTSIGLTIGTLDLGRGWIAHDVKLTLGLVADRISFDDVQMALGGGRAGGRLTLRRDGKAAALAGHIDVDRLTLDSPALRATVSGALDIAGTGDNLAMLVGGLAGGGTVSVSRVTLPHLEPTALAKILTASEKDEFLADPAEIGRTLAQALDTGQLNYGGRQLGVALATGVLRFDPIGTDMPPLRVETSAAIDLRNWSLDQRTTLTQDPPTADWSGAPPSVSIESKGPIATPTRSIDAAALINGLAARAIERESERIEMLDADIRERAFFNRRLKADDYQRQREQELNRFAEEERRRRAEEERRRAQEAAAARAAATPPAAIPAVPFIAPAPAPLVPRGPQRQPLSVPFGQTAPILPQVLPPATLDPSPLRP